MSNDNYQRFQQIMIKMLTELYRLMYNLHKQISDTNFKFNSNDTIKQKLDNLNSSYDKIVYHLTNEAINRHPLVDKSQELTKHGILNSLKEILEIRETTNSISNSQLSDFDQQLQKYLFYLENILLNPNNPKKAIAYIQDQMFKEAFVSAAETGDDSVLDYAIGGSQSELTNFDDVFQEPSEDKSEQGNSIDIPDDKKYKS